MADSSSPPRNLMALAPSLRTPGYRLIDAGELYNLLNSLFSVQSGITARGTTQATAFRLTAGINQLTTVTAGNAGVMLPVGLPGKEITVVNQGAAAATVYGFGGDQIIPIASSTGAGSLAQAAGTTGTYICVSQTFNPTVSVWKQTAVQ